MKAPIVKLHGWIEGQALMTREQEAPEEPEEVQQGGSLADFYRRNGVAWGAADLFMIGDRVVEDHVAEFLAVLRAMRHRDGRPAFHTVVVVLPPFEKEPSEYLDGLKLAFPDAVCRVRGHTATPAEVTGAFSNVLCVRCDSLDGSAAVELIQELRPKSAALVTHGALYRVAGVETRQFNPQVPDDIWTPHLHALIQEAGKAAADADGYVVVDAGVFIPSRKENLDLLMTSEWGVTGAEEPGRSPMTIVKQAEHWNELAAAGRLGTIISEINAIDGLSAERKVLIRLQMLSSIGLGMEVRKELEAQPELTEGLDPTTALKVAILANDSDANSKSIELLSSAVDGLKSQEDLEAALNLAAKVGGSQLTSRIESTLSRRFPASEGLRRHRLTGLLRARNYDAAAMLFEHDPSQRHRDDFEYFTDLSKTLDEGRDIDVQVELRRLSERFPSRRGLSVRACAFYLEARGQRDRALAMLFETAAGAIEPDRRAIGLALDMVERGRLLLDTQVDDNLVLKVVEWFASDLSRLPRDGYLRLRLARLFSPEVLGSGGLPTIAAVVLSFFRRPITPRPTTPVNLRSRACDPDELRELFRRGTKWLVQERPIVIGARRFPAEDLNVPADQAIAGLTRMVEYMGRRVEDDGDVQTIETCVAIAAGIAHLASDPNEDLLVLRLAAMSLAIAGRVQRARDLVEQALSMSREDPHRCRLAWFGFADVYARLGNFGEALIGLACCAVAEPRPTWDQVWYETLLLLRIFRDLGMMMLARPLLVPARHALTEMGAPAHYAFRLDTIELQIRLLELDAAEHPHFDQVTEIIADLSRNARAIMETDDEIEPVATLLANALRLANEEQVTVPEESTSLLTDVLAIVSPMSRAFIEAAGALRPSIEQLLPLVRRMEVARHAEDVGFDIRNLVIMARRVLKGGESIDAKDAVYASELLTDQATVLPVSDGRSRFLGIERDAPALTARSLSKLGISVVTLAKCDTGLVRTVSSQGVLEGPFIEPSSAFSQHRFSEWSENYPYGYGQVADVNEFYVSTSGIGVSGLPDRSVIVASTDIQSFPPNLLDVGGNIAGRSRRLASAPSLAWLKMVLLDSKREFDGRISAWIPDAAPEGELTTLGMVSERLRDNFVNHSVALSKGPAPPEGLAGSDMAIVVAHGGLTEEARYFSVVADDVDLAIASTALSGALADIGVVVLFVCSGGRLDKHPGASTTVGLVKRLLDEGCCAVIAPPWPIDVSVPPNWLPTFLAEWATGACVIDACFAANEMVRTRLGDDPAKYLAMSVHGNPLQRKSATVSTPSP
jgi:tetratricopeptide (TPR) repeat protein